MRCQACNALLTNFEATQKERVNNKVVYFDLCIKCMTPSNYDSIDPEDFDWYNGEFDNGEVVDDDLFSAIKEDH